jgi:hypothetical protein
MVMISSKANIAAILTSGATHYIEQQVIMSGGDTVPLNIQPRSNKELSHQQTTDIW